MARMLRTDRGLDRLVNFSDATVAIAITLMLLPLVDIASEIEEKSLGHLLEDNVGTLVAFFVSFLVISRVWLSHHRLFEATRSYSPRILVLNFVWLASIAFLPFSSNLIAHAERDPAVNAFYIGTIVVSSAAMAAMQWTVWRDPTLIVEEGRSMLHPIDGTLTVVALLLAMLGAVLFPGGGPFWLFLLAPAGWASAALERRYTGRITPSHADHERSQNNT